jgi:TetR/AcrR family transcriptional regulator, regulator of cefoperazone and chloramphenicol sensitivity
MLNDRAVRSGGNAGNAGTEGNRALMSTDAPDRLTASFSDLTAYARLRETAMRMFAEHGFEGVSLRAIARDAGVSAPLVTHHFGSKEGLREAVDEHLLQIIGRELDQRHFDPAVKPEDLVAELGRVTARLIGLDGATRGYLRRVLLDGGPAGEAMFRRLVEGTRRQLEKLSAAGRLGPEADPVWSSYQVLFLILGPLLLEPVMRRTFGRDVFEADLVAERSLANQRLLETGLFRPADSDRE